MKKKTIKSLALALTLALATPVTIIPIQDNTVTIASAAAAPRLNFTNKTLIGTKDTLTLEVINKVKGATYSWSSSNPDVATVNYRGDVTPVGKGTTVINCRVTYPNKKTIKNLKSTIKVGIPATSIAISNEKLSENKAHVIEVGQKYDFNRSITPKGTSHYTYWKIEEDSNNQGVATVDSKGIVTGHKVGLTRLKVVAASNKKNSLTSDVYDAITISVVDKVLKTATVKNVKLISAKELQVTFDSPMDITTLIQTGTKELKDNVRIVKNITKDSKTVDPGKLTGALSEDMKTLTITPANTFAGSYDVAVTSGALTTDKVSISTFFETLTFEDKTGPSYPSVTMDDSGVINTLTFNEPLDISKIKVESVVIGNAVADFLTTSIISNISNYVLSTDKKSIKIDLSQIATADKNKEIFVMMSGIKDVAGNNSDPYIMPVSLITDTTPRPQARIVTVRRTSYNTVAVQYNRAIRTPGMAMLGGNSLYGQVDVSDKTIVNYTLNAQQSALRGSQTMSIGYWDAYNVITTDYSANAYTNVPVNFDVDSVPPYVTEYNLDSVTTNGVTYYNLNLVFSENIILNSASGILTTTVNATNGNILPNTNLSYTATTKDNVATLTFLASQMSTVGNYTAFIPSGLVKDVYFNASISKEVTFSQNGAAGTELPAPTSVKQRIDNPSEIEITFANKLDKTSAETAANYTLPGIAIIHARLVEQTETKAVVVLTIGQGAIAYNTSYPLTISGVKDYNNTFRPIANYQEYITLKENKAPVAQRAVLTSGWNTVEITFSEAVTGIPKFLVYQNGTLLNSETSSNAISNNKVYVSLTRTPNGTSGITVVPASGSGLTDLNGNAAIMNTLPVY